MEGDTALGSISNPHPIRMKEGKVEYFSGKVIIQKGFPIRFSFCKKGIVEVSLCLAFLKKWFMWSWIKEG